MKALETQIFGLRLNDLSANDVLLAMEYIRHMNIPVPVSHWDEGRRSEIAKYLIEMASVKHLDA